MLFLDKFQSMCSMEKRSFNKMQYPSMSRREDSRVQWSAADPIRKFRADQWIGGDVDHDGRPDEGRKSRLFRAAVATLLGRVTLTYFSQSGTSATCDRSLHIAHVFRIDMLATLARLTENLMNINWRTGLRIKYNGMVIDEAAFRGTIHRQRSIKLWTNGKIRMCRLSPAAHFSSEWIIQE